MAHPSAPRNTPAEFKNTSRVIGTWHNYPYNYKEQLYNVYTRLGKYLVYQEEICPTSGRPHIQLYLEAKKSLPK